jgi:hypothetical protein
MITQLKSLEAQLAPLFTIKAPFQLPEVWREGLVKYSPWIMLIFVPLSLLAIGFGTIASIFSMFSFNFFGALALLLSIISMVLDLIAIKPLFERKRVGWDFIFYAWLVSLLSSLVSFSIFGLVLGFFIGGFFLFQVRNQYVH